jgi:hypothetical protein
MHDNDQSQLIFELLASSTTNTSAYELHKISSNSTQLILRQSITHDHEDNLTIRIWDETISASSFHIDQSLRIVYLQRSISYPQIVPQTIDGYMQFDDQLSTINLGALKIENQSNYQWIFYNLIPDEHFRLKRITSNQTELYFMSMPSVIQQNKGRLLKHQVHLTTFALNSSIPFDNQTKINLPDDAQSSLKVHTIDIHLWSIDKEMLDRTLSLLINLKSSSSYEQFLTESLPLIREHLAQLIGVHLRHVHLYTMERKTPDQIELLLAIIRHPSRLRPSRYLHKKLLYNALQNSTHLFETYPHVQSIEKILINQCQMKSCENNGRCTSHLKLLDDQYEYFVSHRYQRLLPKYQWIIKCLCLNHYHGTRCQYRQDYSSPCASNPCSATERCMEESATLYTCQCIDEPCSINEILVDKTLDCININSPTCRGRTTFRQRSTFSINERSIEFVNQFL